MKTGVSTKKTKWKKRTNSYTYSFIRGTIEKLAGTMSENLPAPNKSIKELENSKLILRMIFIKIDFTYIF